MKYLLWGACMALLFSCGTTENLQRGRAEKFFQEHPDELARKCAALFPNMDSLGKIEYGPVQPGSNDDYQATIDSIVGNAEDLAEQVYKDTSEAGKMYRARIDSLQAKIKALANRYKPCVPDTVPMKIPHYIENTARVAALQAENAKQKAAGDICIKESKEWAKKAKNRFWAIVAVSAVGGIGFVAWVVGQFKTIKIS